MSDGIEKIRTGELKKIIGSRGDQRSGISGSDSRHRLNGSHGDRGHRIPRRINGCIRSTESEIISETPMGFTGTDGLICGSELESKFATGVCNYDTLSHGIIDTGISGSESGIDSSGQSIYSIIAWRNTESSGSCGINNNP
jgi:hypothetical protein